jgi:hypothetical protein
VYLNVSEQLECTTTLGEYPRVMELEICYLSRQWLLCFRCALVVSQDDVRSANDLIRELRHHSSAHGNALQRMAYYYVEALVSSCSKLPSKHQLLR